MGSNVSEDAKTAAEEATKAQQAADLFLKNIADSKELEKLNRALEDGFAERVAQKKSKCCAGDCRIL